MSLLVLLAPVPLAQEFFNELADMATSGRQPSEDELIGFYQRHDHYQVDVVAET